MDWSESPAGFGAGFEHRAILQLRALRKMQEHLGEMQDAHAANTRLSAMAAETRGTLRAGTVFAMGRYAERRVIAAEKARDHFPKVYRKVRGKRWKALRHAMAALRPATATAPTPTETSSKSV